MKEEFTFDDMGFAWSDNGKRSATRRGPVRPPGFENNRAWYAWAGQIVRIVDEATGTAGELPPLPLPDTHCYDEDAQSDVWSHSKVQMREYGQACAEAARRPAPEGRDEGIEVAFLGLPPGTCLHELEPWQEYLEYVPLSDESRRSGWVREWRCKHCLAIKTLRF